MEAAESQGVPISSQLDLAGTRAQSARVYARLSGGALLVAVASIVVFHGGMSIVGGGTRPDDPDASLSTVRGFFGHPALGMVVAQAIIGVVGLAAFGLGFRRYVSSFRPRAEVVWLADLGVAMLLIDLVLVATSLGLEQALVKLVLLRDPAASGAYQVFTWIYDGTSNWPEAVAFVAISAAALRVAALPSWLGWAGVLVGLLLLVLAAPAQLLAYPNGITLGAYGPEIVWLLVLGIYLSRGGRAIPT